MNDEDIIIFNNSDFETNPQLNSEQELKQLEFKPKKVRYLLLGESMPDGRSFFYFENSDLFRYTKEVFLNNFSWKDKEFLKYFMLNGFYLDDLCQEPVNQFDNVKRRKARKAYEPDLAERIKEYKPLIIISLLKIIKGNVNNAIFKSGLSITHIAINSPFFGGQFKYKNELDEVIKENIKPLFLKPSKK